MKKEIKLKDAIGKVLTDYSFSHFSKQGILVFGDEFTTLDIDIGYDRGEETIEEGKLSIHHFEHNVLIDLGIFSKKELNDINERESAERKKRSEKWEKEQYEKLRLKYGDKS